MFQNILNSQHAFMLLEPYYAFSGRGGGYDFNKRPCNIRFCQYDPTTSFGTLISHCYIVDINEPYSATIIGLNRDEERKTNQTIALQQIYFKSCIGCLIFPQVPIYLKFSRYCTNTCLMQQLMNELDNCSKNVANLLTGG